MNHGRPGTVATAGSVRGEAPAGRAALRVGTPTVYGFNGRSLTDNAPPIPPHDRSDQGLRHRRADRPVPLRTARHIADNGRYVVLSTTLTAVMTGTYGLYSGSKAAVERMILAAAKELGARGITVNAVAPGPIDDSFYRAAETPESIAAATHHSPRGRLGLPEDIAPVVGWLISDEGRMGLRTDGASQRCDVLATRQ
jgi:NAD(P)-dependent dehydrogenase (short-subunit alcohol dehydrogenase family)